MTPASNPWIVVVLGGAGGSIYWLVAGRMLGVSTSTSVECLAVGAASGLASWALRRARHKP